MAPPVNIKQDSVMEMAKEFFLLCTPLSRADGHDTSIVQPNNFD